MNEIVKLTDNLPQNLEEFLEVIEKFGEKVNEKRKKVTEKKTPEEVIGKKPIGGRLVDYVPYSYVDNEFKKNFPLYSMKFERIELIQLAPFEWFALVAVSVTDRTTGNNELGISMHRIQLKKDSKEKGIVEFVDPGNDIKACLSEAIKNAQARFGIASDVYQRRELDRTDEERRRFEELISKVKRQDLKEQLIGRWKDPDLDVEGFLNALEEFVSSPNNK